MRKEDAKPFCVCFINYLSFSFFVTFNSFCNFISLSYHNIDVVFIFFSKRESVFINMIELLFVEE